MAEYFKMERCRGEHMLAKPTEIFLYWNTSKTQHEPWTTESNIVPAYSVHNLVTFFPPLLRRGQERLTSIERVKICRRLSSSTMNWCERSGPRGWDVSRRGHMPLRSRAASQKPLCKSPRLDVRWLAASPSNELMHVGLSWREARARAHSHRIKYWVLCRTAVHSNFFRRFTAYYAQR